MLENTVSSNRYTLQCQIVKQLSPVDPPHSGRGWGCDASFSGFRRALLPIGPQDGSCDAIFFIGCWQGTFNISRWKRQWKGGAGIKNRVLECGTMAGKTNT
jgi:hypothetical protein